MFEQIVRVVLDVTLAGNLGVEGNDDQSAPGTITLGR